MRIVGELLAEIRPRRARPCEHQGVDPLVQQGRTRVASALQQVEHPGRQVGLGQAFGHQLAGQGRLLRRLEHDGVAGQQGRDDMAVGQMAGEVERAQYRRHTVRTVAQGRMAEGGLGRALAGALVIGADRDVDLAGHGGQFGVGLPQGLAGLAADGLGHLGRAALERGLIALHRVDPVLTRAVGPVGEGGAGGLDGGGGVSRGGGLALPDGFAGGGVGRGEMGHGIALRP
jgi:hypothetical protein